MEGPPIRPTFLGIPLEIRQHIYREMLSFPASDQIRLLCVCNKVLAEAKEFLYRRPLVFDSQRLLFAFMVRADKTLLDRVTKLKIRILNITVDEAQPWLSAIVEGSTSFDSPDHPLRAECARIVLALSHMPKIEDLTILKATGVDNAPPCDLYEGIFIWIKNNYTALRSLALEIHGMPLSFLPLMRGIQSFHFTGFSVASPEDTLKVLNSLPLLEELKVSGPPSGVSVIQRRGWRRMYIVRSITTSVLLGLKPLSSIQICEILDSYIDGIPTFLTVDTVNAIKSQHAGTLTRLGLTANFDLPGDVVASTGVLLESLSNVHHLRIGWPNMDTSLLDELPAKVESLEIPVSLRAQPVAVAEKVLARSGELKHLRSVMFGVWNDGTVLGMSAVPLIDPEAIERFRDHGVRVRLEVWDVFGADGRQPNTKT